MTPKKTPDELEAIYEATPASAMLQYAQLTIDKRDYYRASLFAELAALKLREMAGR